MAEAHPVGFQWVMEAKARGAKVFHVDPRFTRTSALADTLRADPGGHRHRVPRRRGQLHPGQRAGLPGVRARRTPTRRRSSARTSATPRTSTGCSPASTRRPARYDPAQLAVRGPRAAAAGDRAERRGAGRPPPGMQHESHGGPAVRRGDPQRDETLQHPRCVYQILKRHFARYTPEMVERVCGVPQEQFLEVCRGVDGELRPGAHRPRWSTRSGWTQHSVGVQYIRTGAIIQLLLGNMGRPGGGVMALRGHASIQGSTDIPTLFNLLPGYLPMPHHAEHPTFDEWVDSIRHPGQKGFWAQRRAYAVSLLKAYWGDAATAENDFCYGYLPRLTGDHGTYQQVLNMIDGQDQGVLPARAEPGGRLGARPGAAARHGQPRLAGGPRPVHDRERHVLEERPGGRHRRDRARGVPHRGVLPAGRLARGEGGHVHPDPAAAAVAGEGRRAAGRLPLRAVVLLPPGPADPGEAGRLDRPARPGAARPDLGLPDARRRPTPSRAPRRCCARSTGTTWRPGGRCRLHRGPGRRLHRRAAAGSTRGVYADGVNQAARRKPRHEQDWVAPEWGWAWPANRRILYNRASADPDGRPWSERKTYVWWDADAGRVDRLRRAGLREDQAAVVPAAGGRVGPAALAGDDPFVMQGDGKGWLYAPSGLHRRAAADALRAGRVAGAQPALRPAGQPDPQGVRPLRRTRRTRARRSEHSRGLPVRVHDQPAHRAPHRRRDEPRRCRTWPSCSRRCSSRCPRSWPPSAG